MEPFFNWINFLDHTRRLRAVSGALCAPRVTAQRWTTPHLTTAAVVTTTVITTTIITAAAAVLGLCCQLWRTQQQQHQD
jgi:hypothetical protein